MTSGRSEGHWPRRWLYPLLGALLAQGAPLGLLLTLRLHMGHLPTRDFIVGELQSESVTYLYLTLSTTVIFVALGYLLGRREDQLGERAITDALTGVANRRQFDTVVGERLALATRYRTPLSVILLDVDRLKPINDSLGHAAGDVALQRVARSLLGTCRATDVACRIGGDEFAVVLPGTQRDQARELAERIRSALASQPPSRLLGQQPVTVSVGIADLEIAEVPRAENLVGAADRALLRAKAEGRDRVRVADAFDAGAAVRAGQAGERSPAPAAGPHPPAAPRRPLGYQPG